MKKNKLNIFALIALFAGSTFFTSCSNDDATDDSVIEVNDGSASVSAVSPYLNVNSVSTFNEGGYDKTIEFAVNLVTPQPVDTYVTVSLVSGTATEDVDFEYDHQVYIPAWSSSGIGTVKIIGDSEDEATETFVLKVGSEFDANIKVATTNLSFNITDYGDLTLEFAWDRNIPGYPFGLCDIGYDVDVYVLDENGDDITGYAAATSACPEEFTVSLGDVEDGVYTIYMNVYDDATLASVGIPTFDIPITINYSRYNSPFAGTFVQDAGDAVDSDFGNTPNYDQEFIYVATLTVENGIFTFSKNGQFVASGRAAAPRVNITKPVKNIQTRNFFN